MDKSERIVGAQLRIGDSELSTFSIDAILAKIDKAGTDAGLNRLLFLPSSDKRYNKSIVNHCRKHGIEVYLWFKVLSDNSIIPENDELLEDAFGMRGRGETSAWEPIFTTDENFRFACPANRKYNDILLKRCRTTLEDFDGLFIDLVGYPLPSLGLESIFTCFCPVCMAKEPRLEGWRKNVFELRERLLTCTDEDVERWNDFPTLARETGLFDFYIYRTELITALASRYSQIAREAGKEIGLDILSPALAWFAGHDIAALGKISDWLKPRIYCHTYGPSSIPLEYYCMAMGVKSWAQQLSIPAVMDFIGRSINIDMPGNVHHLSQSYLSHEAAKSQIRMTAKATTTPIYPSIELGLHPEFETFLDEKTVTHLYQTTQNSPGLIMAWNLLFIPDSYLTKGGR